MLSEYALLFIIILLIIVIIMIIKREQFTLSDVYDMTVGKYTKKEENVIEMDGGNDNEEVVEMIENDGDLIETRNKYSPKISTFFTPTLFHPDYVDTINVMNRMINTPNTIVFNQDNKRTGVVDADNDEIKMVGSVVEKFIDNLNDRMNKHPKNIVEVLNVNRWDNQPEQSFVDGFEKVRASLGLPKKLYNTSISGNKVELVEYSDVMVEKVIDTDEEEYSCDIVIKREGSRDKMCFRFKFVMDENRVIIDKVNIIGFENRRDISEEYNKMDELYEYKNLNTHNITAVGDILSEMKDKYITREKMMQDNIENLHPEDKLMNARINPYQYESYKATRTVYDDIWNKPMFE